LAETLTVPALHAQIKGKNPKIGDKMDCKHEAQTEYRKCDNCGQIMDKKEWIPEDDDKNF